MTNQQPDGESFLEKDARECPGFYEAWLASEEAKERDEAHFAVMFVDGKTIGGQVHKSAMSVLLKALMDSPTVGTITVKVHMLYRQWMRAPEGMSRQWIVGSGASAQEADADCVGQLMEHQLDKNGGSYSIDCDYDPTIIP